MQKKPPRSIIICSTDSVHINLNIIYYLYILLSGICDLDQFLWVFIGNTWVSRSQRNQFIHLSSSSSSSATLNWISNWKFPSNQLNRSCLTVWPNIYWNSFTSSFLCSKEYSFVLVTFLCMSDGRVSFSINVHFCYFGTCFFFYYKINIFVSKNWNGWKILY